MPLDMGIFVEIRDGLKELSDQWRDIDPQRSRLFGLIHEALVFTDTSKIRTPMIGEAVWLAGLVCRGELSDLSMLKTRLEKEGFNVTVVN